MNSLRVGVLALAALALSACGTISPGAAAVVDGQTISMSTLDDTARVYCEVTARQAEQQGITAIDNAEMRRQAITDLVLAEVGEAVAEERGLEIPPPVEPEPEQLAEAFGADRAPDVAAALGDAQDLYNLFAVIGADEASIPVTPENEADLAEAGRAVVVAAFDDNDVTFSPRLGLADSGEPNGSIGSLSVAPVDLEAPTPDELPGPLACRA